MLNVNRSQNPLRPANLCGSYRKINQMKPIPPVIVVSPVMGKTYKRGTLPIRILGMVPSPDGDYAWLMSKHDGTECGGVKLSLDTSGVGTGDMDTSKLKTGQYGLLYRETPGDVWATAKGLITLACVAVAALLLCLGCASNTRDITYADGSHEKVSQNVFFETMQGYAAHGVGLDGTEWDMSVQNLTGDAALAGTIFQGLDSLAGKAMLFAAGSNTNLLNVLMNATNGQKIALSPSESQKAKRYMMLHTSLKRPAH